MCSNRFCILRLLDLKKMRRKKVCHRMLFLEIFPEIFLEKFWLHEFSLKTWIVENSWKYMREVNFLRQVTQSLYIVAIVLSYCIRFLIERANVSYTFI